jgi:hypothetical protein
MIGGHDGMYLNTFSKEEAESVAARSGGRHPIEKVVKMPLININKVLADHFQAPPTFISLDTEGLDLAILKSLDFARFRAPILCVETLICRTTRQNTEIFDFMTSKNYSIRGATFVNTVFVDNQLLV